MSHHIPSVIESFDQVADPRVIGRTTYPLPEILFTTVCAVICGCDDWYKIALWGERNVNWLRKYIPLANGVPSEDTFGRVFAILDANAFQQAFHAWATSLFSTLSGQVIAIDGKTMRGSHHRRLGKKAIHMVSAFSSQHGITLTQRKVDSKSNEITAIPELLDLLDLKGAVVTMDAMGCQKTILQHIVSQEADYLVGLKGNQASLHDEALEFFDIAETEGYKNLHPSTYTHVEKEHGRLETRRCVVLPVTCLSNQASWPGLQSIVMVESTREIASKTTVEKRYYISSLTANAAFASDIVRLHWRVENQLHWCLDVTFKEDVSRVRKDHAPENMNIIRKLAMNMLKLESSLKGSAATLPNKRMRAMLDPTYLDKVIGLMSKEF